MKEKENSFPIPKAKLKKRQLEKIKKIFYNSYRKKK